MGEGLGRRVLITGAASGIGRAVATELARAGDHVIATARDVSRLGSLEVAERLALDVDDDRSVRAAMDIADPLDVLVNSAGFGVGGPTERVPVEEARKMFETNVFGALRTIQAVVPGMRERAHGAIVLISSMTSRFPWPLGGLYAGSKAALESIGEALQIELRPYGIRVIIVRPGVIRTPLRFLSFGEDAEPYRDLHRQWVEIFARHAPGPERVADAIRVALDGDGSIVRVPVGEDAEELLGARERLDDGSFADHLLEFAAVRWPQERSEGP